VPPLPSLPFSDLARASELLAGTRSRLEKKAILVGVLERTPPDEVGAAVGWLVAEPLCGPLGIGPAQLWKLSEGSAAAEPSVTLREVETALDPELRGGREETAARVEAIFGRLTELERRIFVGALTGSLRQGSLGGVMALAIGTLANQPEAAVRRAIMVKGAIARAAEAMLGAERAAAPPSSLELFHPVAPMLAAHAESIAGALEGIALAQVEWKIDGVRAQVHKSGDRVQVFSRQGGDISHGCASLLGVLRALRADRAVLDGEVALVGPDGDVRAFQDSFSAVATGEMPGEGDRLRLFLFDCLHRDGVDLLDEPLSSRLDALDAVAPDELRVPRLRGATTAAAEAFYEGARASGHEGVMVKDLASPYRLGARGGAWKKVKPFVTVDLVVLAVEWGSGRRKGFLSNLHLGARRADGTFCMVGKTFKGLTDELLKWQTERLLALATEKEGHVVFVRPELVVEIRFNDVQRSPRYPGGVALRFARVVRYREDKSPAETERIEDLVARAPAPVEKTAETKETPKKKQLSLFGD
jgi:DNA ligase-1